MNKYFRRIPKSSIVVSVDLSTFSIRDLECLAEDYKDFKFIKSLPERNYVYCMSYSKKHMIDILGETEDKKKEIESLFRECDNDINTVCTELYITEGRFLELGVGNTQALYLPDWNYSKALYDLTINILKTQASKRITKMVLAR